MPGADRYGIWRIYSICISVSAAEISAMVTNFWFYVDFIWLHRRRKSVDILIMDMDVFYFARIYIIF